MAQPSHPTLQKTHQAPRHLDEEQLRSELQVAEEGFDLLGGTEEYLRQLAAEKVQASANRDLDRR